MRTTMGVAMLLLTAGVGSALAAAEPVSPARPLLRTGTLTAAARALHDARIPAWARRYNMNCSGCHYPAPPRLNETGIRFRWAGYRMPEDLGEKAEVDQVSNYLATRFKAQYVFEKEAGKPTTTSEFTLPDASVFYGGSFGKNFGGFFEVAKEESSVEFGGIFAAVWGKEKSHGGIRFGQSHLLLNAGVAGFDRPVGINAPSPLANPVTAAIPFSFRGDQPGIETFWVAGPNRIAAQVFTASRPGDEGLVRGGKKKDLVLSDQVILDKNGGGLQGTFYYGTVTGLDPVEESLDSHFWRVGLSVSKVVRKLELLGGVVWGKDFNLPAGLEASLGAARNNGTGYWVSSQYTLAKPGLSVYGRYEFIDPNRDADDDSQRRFVVGSVLPVSVPEYLRLGLEYWYDKGSGPSLLKRHSLAAEVMVSF